MTENTFNDFLKRIDRGLSDVERPKMDIDLYINVFHQYFKNPEMFKEDEKLVLGKWLQAIGNKLTVEVDLIDKEGNVVTTLPPLVDVSNIAMEDNGLDKLLIEASLKDKYLAGSGERLYQKAIDKIVNDKNITIRDRWSKAIEEIEEQFNNDNSFINSDNNTENIEKTKSLNSDLDDEFDI